MFLGDLLDLEVGKEITLIDGHVLRRAKTREIGFIREYLLRHQALWTPGINWYEYEAILGNNNSVSYKEIVEKPYNYFVIEFEGMKMDRNIGKAILLSVANLRSIFTGIFLPIYQENSLNLSDNPLTTVNFLSDHDNCKLTRKSISNDVITDIKRLHSVLDEFDFGNPQFDFVSRALTQFWHLGDVAKHSTLGILAHISILEILLTTNTFGESHENSIRRQLTSKLLDLNPLFDAPINNEDFFKGSDTNTISTYLNKIYLYRNDIAHGNNSDFDGKLQVLKSGRRKIPDFLYEIVKQTLRYALKNPVEIKAIKEKLQTVC